MKLKKISLLLCSMLLFACDTTTSISSSPNTSNNDDSSLIISGPLVQSGLEYSLEDNDKINSVLKTSIPCVSSASNYSMREMVSSDGSASAIVINFTGIKNFETAKNKYQEDLNTLGFETFQASSNGELLDVGNKQVGRDLVQIVYYVDTQKLVFVVEAYIFYNEFPNLSDAESWPVEEIYSFTGGIMVPEYNPAGNDGFNYTIGADEYGTYMIISLLYTPDNAIEEYNAILENNNWKLDDSYYNTSFATMIAIDPTNTVKLYYCIDEGQLEITITFNVNSSADGNPDGGGEDGNMTPGVEKPSSYASSNLHGFVLSPSTSSYASSAISINPTDYSVVDSKKFSFNVQCGAFYGGKYYFFTTDYQFGYATYSEESGYGQTYIQSSTNPIINSLYNQGYYLVPMDMSFNYSDNTMYVLWAKWGLVDTDDDGYYDALNEDGFEDQYISKMNLNTYEAGSFKDIVTDQSGGGYTSTVLSGIAFDLDGNLYGVAHTRECLCKLSFSEELDDFVITDYLISELEDGQSWINPFHVTFPGSWLGCQGRLFMEYMHATLAFDYATGKLYYAWSDYESYTIENGSSKWDGELGGIMEIDTTTGIASSTYFFEDDAEITGLFSVYYK